MSADVSNLSYVLRLFGAAQFVKIKALIKSTSFVKNEVRTLHISTNLCIFMLDESIFSLEFVPCEYL